jgi:predicted transcriptional regulator of viral defense system
MLLEYLQENYQKNEPIFVADIHLPVSDTNLRQMLKVLCDKGTIQRFDTGIYYLAGISRLKGGTSLSPGEVVRYKYISRNNKTEGYYSGYTFANQIGISSQVPVVIELVSNEASAKVREVRVKNQRIILRKPRTEINDSNCKVLQLLDLMKDFEQYFDEDNTAAPEIIRTYVRDIKIKRSDVDKYISLFPMKVYKNIYETRLYDVFA